MHKKKIVILYGGDTLETFYSIRAYRFLKKKLANKFDVIGFNIKYFLLEHRRIISKMNDSYFLPLVYGVPGQEGMLQGFLDLFNARYLGSDMSACNIVKNKYIAKLIAQKAGIKTPDFYLFNNDSNYFSCEKKNEFVIKPVLKGGLSKGISYCNDKSSFNKAISEAMKYDTNVFVEKYIYGREFTCCIVKNGKKNWELPLVETIKDDFICGFECKSKGLRKTIISPEIEQNLEKEIVNTAHFLFKLFGMKDYGYFDFIVDKENVFFIEAGAVPGFTETSNFVLLCKYLGCEIEELFLELTNRIV